MPLAALCSLYVQKIKVNFVDEFKCYKQKWKLAPFNLAHFVDYNILSANGVGSAWKNMKECDSPQ